MLSCVRVHVNCRLRRIWFSEGETVQQVKDDPNEIVYPDSGAQIASSKLLKQVILFRLQFNWRTLHSAADLPPIAVAQNPISFEKGSSR